MRRGFTILELLVASLLLGMLVTILTMIFNQSSIAWRTGVEGVAELDSVRDTMATLRDEADNLYVWKNNMCLTLSPWDEDGNVRKRAVSAGEEANEGSVFIKQKLPMDETTRQRDIVTVNVGNGASGKSMTTYTVNVMGAGPDREFDTWDDIWSYPDDFE
jgi:prepilin-type N-terminal cleavage/methylation domain-containing protein